MMSKIEKELGSGFTILEALTRGLEGLIEESPEQEIQAILDQAIEDCTEASEYFTGEGQPWLAAWVDLKKATLHCDLAEKANYLGRGVQAHTAMELVSKTLTVIPDLPANLDLAAKLYITMIETLFRIRALFDKADQLQALDELIRGVAENLGEVQVLDLQFRAEANDLLFTASMLEALADLEEDPEIKKELLETSQDLKSQATSNLMISSPLDLSGYEMPREKK
jgi:hypothetical protein